MNRCIINTHRFGDIFLNLPIAKAWADQGDKVWWCVHEHFADAIRAVSYVTPVIFQGDMNDPDDTERAARNMAPKDAEFICLQAKNLKTHGAKCHRFSVEPWAKAAMLEDFHRLPLVLDRRDASLDAETVAKYWKDNGRPVMVLCLKGYSSNPENCGWGRNGTTDFRSWIEFQARTVLGWDVVDISELKLRNILDLVPLLCRAVALVTVDTAVLHLANVTQTPTFTLSAGSEWDKSEPRHSWIGQATYSEAMTPAGRDRIVRALAQSRPYRLGTMVRSVSDMRCRAVYHGFETPLPGRPSQRSNELARGSWGMLDWSGWRAKSFAKGQRLKEWVASIIQEAEHNDVLCLAPADVALVPEVGRVIADATAAGGCCVSPVVGFDRVEFMHSQSSLSNLNGPVGVYAFTVDWWKGFGDQVSDRVIGAAGWDDELCRIMQASNLQAEIRPPIAYRQASAAAVETYSPDVPAAPASGMIIQVWHNYDAPPDEHRRNLAARPSWDVAADRDGNWLVAEHTIGRGRSSADIGDHRNLPYIIDLLDFGAALGVDSDIIVLANADIHLIPEAGKAIRETLGRVDCCYAWRITVPAGQMTLDQRKLATIRTDFGIDLFACRKSWWLKIRSDYPAFFLGCTGWDVVMRKLMDQQGPHASINPPIYCHEAHESFWKINRTNAANAYNQKLWDEWEARASANRRLVAV